MAERRCAAKIDSLNSRLKTRRFRSDIVPPRELSLVFVSHSRGALHACYLVNNNEKNKRSSARTQKSPGRLSARAHFVSFNFSNSLICAAASSASRCPASRVTANAHRIQSSNLPWRATSLQNWERQKRKLRRPCPLFADRAQEGGQADGSRSDVVISGVVDSGRERGHRNIDANDPIRTSAVHRWSRVLKDRGWPEASRGLDRFAYPRHIELDD